jgi:hypothetical protein
VVLTLAWAGRSLASSSTVLEWAALASVSDDLDIEWRIGIEHVPASPSRVVIVIVGQHRQPATVMPGRAAVAADSRRITATVDDRRVLVPADGRRVVPSA